MDGLRIDVRQREAALEHAVEALGAMHRLALGLEFKGERRLELEAKGETVHRTERFHGVFERSFALPDDVDAKAIHAESRDGVLVVTLPRVAQQKPRPLAITIQ